MTNGNTGSEDEGIQIILTSRESSVNDFLDVDTYDEGPLSPDGTNKKRLQFPKKKKKVGLFYTDHELLNEVIKDAVGCNDRGCCLHHQNQVVMARSKISRYEEISSCRICDSEEKAGGKKHRKSMDKVIQDIVDLQSDKDTWSSRTSIMHHGNADWDDDDELDFTEFTETEINEDDEEMTLVSEEVWMQGLTVRVRQVRARNDKTALKHNLVYRKYYKQLDIGVPVDAVKLICEADGNLPWILDLDRNISLQDQLHGKQLDPAEDTILQNILDKEAQEMEKLDVLLDRVKKGFEKRHSLKLEIRKKNKVKKKLNKLGDKGSEIERTVADLVQSLEAKDKTIEWLTERLLETSDSVERLAKRVTVLEKQAQDSRNNKSKTRKKTSRKASKDKKKQKELKKRRRAMRKFKDSKSFRDLEKTKELDFKSFSGGFKGRISAILSTMASSAMEEVDGESTSTVSTSTDSTSTTGSPKSPGKIQRTKKSSELKPPKRSSFTTTDATSEIKMEKPPKTVKWPTNEDRLHKIAVFEKYPKDLNSILFCSDNDIQRFLFEKVSLFDRLNLFQMFFCARLLTT